MVAPLIGLVLLFVLSSAILFRAGHTGFPSTTSAAVPFLPANDDMVSEIDFGRNSIPAAMNNTASIENKTLLAEAPVKKLQSASKPSADPVEDIITEPVIPSGFAMPVAIRENDATKQIIIQEEGSGSASVKTYYLVFENGKWILQPEWVITAKAVILDSLTQKIDSLTKKIKKSYPAEQ
jgi:hypothetical protein